MKFLFTFLFLAFAVICFAQKRESSFIKADETIVSTLDSADYIRIVTQPDTNVKWYIITDYFKSGKLQMAAQSTTLNSKGAQGEAKFFYENGNKQAIAYYSDGELVGSQYGFFPNGRAYLTQVYPEKPKKPTDPEYLITANFDSLGVALVTNGNGYYKEYDDDFKYIYKEGPVKNGKTVGEWKIQDDHLSRVENYDDSGKFISGKATNIKNGEIRTYTQENVLPAFPGGPSAFTNYLTKNIYYPLLEKTLNIQGRVIVKFIVETNGRVTNVTVANHVNPALDGEAIRVIENSPPWVPGLQYGFPVRAQFTVPINFALSQQRN